MSADQRLGSDPLSWLKDKDQKPAAEETGGASPLEGFQTPQDAIDEICASCQTPPPDPAWRPRQVLNRLSLALCVYAPSGEVLYANPAWFDLCGVVQGELGRFGDFFQDRISPDLQSAGSSMAVLHNSAQVILERFWLDSSDGPGYGFATIIPQPAEEQASESTTEAGEGDDRLDGDKAYQNLIDQLRPWGLPGEEAQKLLQAFAGDQAHHLNQDSLSQDSLIQMLKACGPVLERHLQTTQGSYELKPQVEFPRLSSEWAVLVVVLVLEILRICLSGKQKSFSGGDINCLIAAGPDGGLVIRLYAAEPLKPVRLKFHLEDRDEFAFLADLIIANKAALLVFEGNQQELRVKLP